MTQHSQDRLFLHAESSSVGADIAAHDWSETVLGPMDTWPVSLRTTLATMLACPVPMFLAWGPDLISFYNDAYRPILGYRATYALGMPFRDLWTNIWDDIGPLVDATLAGRSTKMVDMRLDVARANTPEESYWTFSYSPVLDEQGQVAGLLCVTSETTERIMAEREKIASDERLHLALSAGGSIGIWDWDVVNDRVTADLRFAMLYGVDPDLAATGRPIAEYFTNIHPHDVDRVREEIGSAMKTSGPFRSEYRLLMQDGQVRWVSAQGHCIVDNTGRCLRLPGASFDITKRKEAELELRAAKEERDFVVALMTRQRAFSDPDTILHYSSEALGRRLGGHRVGFYRVIDGKHILHSRAWSDGRLPPLHGNQAIGHYGSFAADERRQGRTLVFADSRTEGQGRFRNYADDGVLAGICVPLMAEGHWAAGIYLHQGEVRHWTEAEISLTREVATQTWLAIERAEAQLRLAQWIDLQEAALVKGASDLQEQSARRKAAEEQLRQLQKMEAVGQLTGGIAHDFNNMLAVVISGLNLTQRRLRRGDVNVQDFIDGAMGGAQRAAVLTQRLLAFARQQPLAPEAINANSLVEGISGLLVRSLGETVVLETDLAEDLWNAKIDPSQLENALVNLAVNARDAMPDGGRVSIRTENADIDPERALDVQLKPGSYVRISVSDSGTGMTSDTLARAFEPFFTTKGVGKGTGLGLSQVFGFIHQSGGQVLIDSQVGAGTTVSLYVPRHSEGEALATAALTRTSPVHGGGQNELVLVVEDEEQVRLFSVEALRELGYSVIDAPGGAEALRLLEQRPDVEVLFTDVVMPEMTGRQLAERASALRPDLQVIFTSGYTGNAFLSEGSTDERPDILPKPFDIEELGRKMREALDRRRKNT